MEKRNDPTEYDLYNGLFGQTDRNSGEYHFKSGTTQQIYSNASYIPVNESADPPRYYKPSIEEKAPQKKKKGKTGLAIILILCLSCALLGGLSGAIIANSVNSRSAAFSTSSLPADYSISSAGEEAQEESVGLVPGKTLISDSSSDTVYSASDIYSKACSQVVSINTEKYVSSRSGEMIPSNIAGTGFFVSDDGYILTNYHVIEEAYRNNYPVIVTTYDGTEVNAGVVGFEQNIDVALLKANLYGCSYVELGDSDGISVGEDIYIIGNPYGVLGFTFTSGHIAGPVRQVDSADTGIPTDMFQLDADIYEGNSGGPVFDGHCRVIGIVTAKFSNSSNDSIGFAVPINNAKSIMSNLMSLGYVSGKATLGVDYYDKYNDVMANWYGLPPGAYISNVRPGSCAESAGIIRDDIIVQIGNHGIYGKSDCEEAIRQYKAGESEVFVIYRDGSYFSTTVTFDEATA